jgi:hypothetical protein
MNYWRKPPCSVTNMSAAVSTNCATNLRMQSLPFAVRHTSSIVARLRAAAAATQPTSGDGASVVYAATFDGRLVGFADFLVHDGQQHRVTDTTPACSAKATALSQLVGQPCRPGRPDDLRKTMVYTHPAVNSHYKNSSGTVPTLFACRMVDYWKWTNRPNPDFYELRP